MKRSTTLKEKKQKCKGSEAPELKKIGTSTITVSAAAGKLAAGKLAAGVSKLAPRSKKIKLAIPILVSLDISEYMDERDELEILINGEHVLCIARQEPFDIDETDFQPPNGPVHLTRYYVSEGNATFVKLVKGHVLKEHREKLDQ